MRPPHDRGLGEIGQGGGVSGGGPVVCLRRQGCGLGGSAGQVCSLLPHRGGGQGLWQAGGRGGAAAQTPERVGAPRVRPHPYAVSPTKSYPKCSGPGVRPPRGSLP
jgi:hypothetical protein